MSAHSISSPSGYYSDALGTFYDLHCGTTKYPEPVHSLVKDGKNRHDLATFWNLTTDEALSRFCLIRLSIVDLS